METFKRLLIKLYACSDAREWASDKSIEEVVATCHRGDWLLWLAKNVDVPLQELTLAKGHCAATILHLMKDERSKNAVKVAIEFGEGKVTRKELEAADADAAAAAATAAAYATAGATAATAAYATAGAAAAYATAYASAATAAATAAYAAAAAATAGAGAAGATARIKNQMKTADICRKYIGQIIIDKVNELLTDNQ